MRIQLPSGTPAELLASQGGSRRGVVIIPDIMGLRPLFESMGNRLVSEHDWTVCVIEPFPGRESMSMEERMAALRDVDDERLLADVLAGADMLNVNPVAVMGFCMGGMYAMKAAGTGRFDRAVSFYGMIRVPEQWRGPGQGEPLEGVRRDESCPVLAIIGTADVWTPAQDVDDLETAGATVVRYEGAEHGFVHDPGRPAHRPADAADAWRRVIEFLDVPAGSGSRGAAGTAG